MRPSLCIQPSDPGVAGDAHQSISGQQHPRFRQADPERGMMPRQKQVEQRIAGLSKGERQRSVLCVAIRKTYRRRSRTDSHCEGKVGGMISPALRPAQSKRGTFSIARRCAISSRALASE